MWHDEGFGFVKEGMKGTTIKIAIVTAGAGVTIENAAPLKVYRVFGGDSKQMGTFWTTVNPNSITDFASKAGLPAENQMTSVVEGVLTDTKGVTFTSAAPGAHGPGGLPEVQIPNPAAQVKVTSVKPFNPPKP